MEESTNSDRSSGLSSRDSDKSTSSNPSKYHRTTTEEISSRQSSYSFTAPAPAPTYINIAPLTSLSSSSSVLSKDIEPESMVSSPNINKVYIEKYGLKIFAEYPHIIGKLNAIVEAPKFQQWLSEFNKDDIDFQEFYVTDVDFFGPVQPARLGFLKGYGKVFDKSSGDAIPSIVFLRGNSIAVLIIIRIKETEEKFVLLCKQLRFPCGKFLIEACAGMIDSETKNVNGVVFNEIRQETGFVLVESELISLGAIRPSGGGCDEKIHLYAWEHEITLDEYNQRISDKVDTVYGSGKHEKIRLIFYNFIEFESVVDTLEDVKAECCWRRYCKAANKKF